MRVFIHNLLNLLIIAILFSKLAYAAESFIIEDIRIEGLQRITPGTVFNYLPMKVGDEFDDSRSGEAVRALFKTGFFDDIRLERDGNVLVFILKERPAIGSITLNGNETIKSDDLIDGLRQIGFAEGRVFNQAQLEKLTQELKRQYFSLGKYAVEIDSDVNEIDNNRVAVVINISEGLTAKIKQINIIGNEAFKEKKLLKLFELTTPTILSFFTKSDQYSRQKLSGDLEALRSYYLDNGYVDFNIESTQVSITPDKRDIYITVNIREGEIFRISEIKLAGDLILPEEELIEEIELERNEIFSRKKLNSTTEGITDRLGDVGYAFANVNAVPDINKEEKTVAVTFFIDPGKRAYVRRIAFSGNTRTRDEVLRREMRQQEGAWISTAQVERGKVRLQRLGYFEEVNVETPAVPGTTDQVDVNYSVVENPSGRLLAGLGFSQSAGLTFQTSVTQDNFLGSGKSIGFDFNTSDINRRFGLSYTNPYWTVDGISRGFNAYYRETDATDANISRFESTSVGGGVNFGIPITEHNTLSTRLEYENTEIDPDGAFAQEIIDFINSTGDNQFDILRFVSAFTYDTRNKAILPTAGTLHRIGTEIGVPFVGDALEFYKVEYKTSWFTSLYEDYILNLRGNVGYGDVYGDTEIFPFFENFFAGGPRSVRGYEDNTLGPRDSLGRPFGGNVKLVGNAEVILPVPFLQDVKSVRISGFVDAGNVFGEDEDVSFDLIRYSAGISGLWVSPFGVVSVSLAAPFGDEPNDETQPFQFTFGTSF